MRARKIPKHSRAKSAMIPAPRSRPTPSAPAAAQFSLSREDETRLWLLIRSFARRADRPADLALIETLIQRGLGTARQLQRFAVVRTGTSDFDLRLTLAPSSAAVVLADDDESPAPMPTPAAQTDRSDDILDELKAIHNVLARPQKVTVIRHDGKASTFFRETATTQEKPEINQALQGDY